MLCEGAWIATAMLKQPFSPTFSANKVSTIEFSKKTLMYICIVGCTDVFY